MALKLALKPHEKVIIGGAVILNGSSTAHFVVENNVPILRQADIMSESAAKSPCKRIYFAIQLMYIDEQNSSSLHPVYWELVKEVLNAAPSMKGLISQISQYMLEGNYYKALKHAKKLVAYEEELIRNVSESC